MEIQIIRYSLAYIEIYKVCIGADAVFALMKAYFHGTRRPIFDFSDIREKGVRLVTAGGKAPGPEPLKKALGKIELILSSHSNGDKLSDIEVHDMVCHIANAVLAGGIRRAALICLFDKDSEAMLNCKSGEWWVENEQRGRANNSAVLLRSETTEEDFNKVFAALKDSQAGEPGFYFTNNKDLGANPCCFVGSTQILTSDGYKEIGSIVDDKELMFINVNGEYVNGKVWSNGVKKVIEIKLSDGKSIKCTPDHRFMLYNGAEKEAKDLLGKALRPNITDRLEVNIEIPKVIEVIDNGEEAEVFDFSLDDDTHWGVIEGVIAHNCEISLYPYQFCNL